MVPKFKQCTTKNLTGIVKMDNSGLFNFILKTKE